MVLLLRGQQPLGRAWPPRPKSWMFTRAQTICLQFRLPFKSIRVKDSCLVVPGNIKDWKFDVLPYFCGPLPKIHTELSPGYSNMEKISHDLVGPSDLLLVLGHVHITRFCFCLFVFRKTWDFLEQIQFLMFGKLIWSMWMKLSWMGSFMLLNVHWSTFWKTRVTSWQWTCSS